MYPVIERMRLKNKAWEILGGATGAARTATASGRMVGPNHEEIPMDLLVDI